VRGTAGVMEW